MSTCKTYHKPLSICKVYQGRILVRAPFELKDRLKEIPTARWLPAYKCWSFSPTPAIALRLDTALGTYQADKQFHDLLEQSFKQAEAQATKDAEDLPVDERTAIGLTIIHKETGRTRTIELRGAVL